MQKRRAQKASQEALAYLAGSTETLENSMDKFNVMSIVLDEVVDKGVGISRLARHNARLKLIRSTYFFPV